MKNKVLGVTTAMGLITVAWFVGNTQTEIERNTLAIQKAEATIMGQCFQDKLLNSKLDETQTNGLTKTQVLEYVRGSKTTIELEAYRKSNSVVGYTYASTDRIWFNRKFHDKFTPCQVAANLSHELMHKLGFKHDVKATKRS